MIKKIKPKTKLNRNLKILIISLSLLAFIVSLIFVSPVEGAEQNERFTIIVLPDTQKYPAKNPEIFTNQTQWIVNNKEKLNIQFVIHEGDIVAKENNIEQWERADFSMSILDKNNIPYSVIPGNNDKNKKNGSTINYNSYFPVSRFSDKEWWGGNYNENDNNYQLLTIQGKEYIFISLDFCPTDDELLWADNVLKNYPQRSAILTTHGYINGGSKRNVHKCGKTEYIWEKLIKNHKNLRLVLSGHETSVSRRTDNNAFGNPVHQVLANYQTQTKGGNGWLRILEFIPAENKVYIKTYSPYINSYKTDSKNQFEIVF